MDVTTSGEREGFGRAIGNLLKRGVTLVTHKPEKVFTPDYPDTREEATDDLACRVEKYSGPRGK